MLSFYYGEDDFQIYKASLKQLNDQAALLRFNSTEADWVNISAELNSSSLFQSAKIIIINNPFSAKKPEILNGLVGLLENQSTQPSANDLIITEDRLKIKIQAGKKQPVILDIEGRGKPLTKIQSRLFELLNQADQVKYFPKLSGAEAEKLLNTLAKEKDCQIEPLAGRLLLNLTAYNFWQISHELNKLANYHSQNNPQKAIGEREINLLVNDTSNHLFELIEAISNQNLAATTRLLEEVIGDETDLIISTNLLVRQTLQFLKIKAQLEAGDQPIVIEKTLGLPITVSRRLV
ncbi:MAG TPA: hypothetical protein PKN62_02415, partial [bacterium]|nr:hypothetical protein [bacterium]